MKIACLSGKGGAGKTFIAVNLAAAAGECTYIDCDVEEPNGHLFFKPENITQEDVTTLLPTFNEEKCDGCKKCVEFCRFHALIYIKDKPMLFKEVCHSCGGCKLVCDRLAIKETANKIGKIEVGMHNEVKVVSGVLNTGEVSGVPVIKKALKYASGISILDAPPGSACSVMETIMDADYCVLVAEPTAFGFHNIKMVYELSTLLNKKCGLIINKQTHEYLPLEEFCKENNIPILARILYNKDISRIVSDGKILVETDIEQKQLFNSILEKIGGCV